MKRFLFLLFAFGMTSVYAQKDEIFGNDSKTPPPVTQDEGYSLTSGIKTLEVSFNPSNIFVNGGDALSLTDGNFKFRSFSSANKAFRLGFNINYSRASSIIQDGEAGNGLKELRSYTSVFGLSFMPGMEKHFEVSDRISPYIGFQAIIGYKSTSYIEEYQNASRDIQNNKYINYSTDGGGAGRGYLVGGVGFLTGVDFYFVKRFYVGAELGIGLEYFTYLNSRYVNSENSYLNREYKHGNLIQISPGLSTGNIRLGWTF